MEIRYSKPRGAHINWNGQKFDVHTAADLEEMPVLCQGQVDDLHIDEDGVRYWLSRCGVADGEPYRNKVTIELYVKGCWTEILCYPG